MAGTTFDRIADLERQLAALQLDRNSIAAQLEEKHDQVGRLSNESAAQEGTIQDRDTEIRCLKRQIEELEPKVVAKDKKIGELTMRIEALELQVTALQDKDPLAVAREQIEAQDHLVAAEQARLDRVQQGVIARRTELEEDEGVRKRSSARKIQIWGGILAPIVTLLVMGVIGLVKKEIPQIHLLIGIPIISAILAVLSPYIMNVVEKIAPSATRNWRFIAHGLSGALGITFSSLGIIENQPSLVIFAVWLGVSLGFTVMFSVLIEAFYIIFNGPEDKRKYASMAVIAVIVSLLTTAFYRPIGESWGLAPSYVINALLGMVGFGFLGLGSMISMLLASMLHGLIKFLRGWVEDFIKAARSKGKNTTMSEKGAKFVLLFCSIFAGILVGYGFSKAHNDGFMGTLVGVGSGIGITMILILIEGMAIWAIFNKDFGLIRKLVTLIVAAGVVSIPAYVTFGSVYYTNSEGTRFDETKMELATSMDGYLTAVEGNCKQLAESLAGDPTAKMYIEPITQLHKARNIVSSASTRSTLKQAFELFMQSAPQAAICLNDNDREAQEKGKGPLTKVILYPDPKPTDLSSQYWRGTVIPGVSIDNGAATSAIVFAVSFDYFLLMYLVFVLVVTAFLNKETVEVERQGTIISILPPVVPTDSTGAPQGATGVIINLGSDKGVELDDALNAHDDSGKPIGSLKVSELLGNGACLCTVQNKFEPTVGQVVSLL